MRDPLEILDNLAARARREEAPRIDVARKVILRLHEGRRSERRPLALFAMGSLVAAAVAMVLVLPLVNVLTDPLAAFLQQTTDIAAAITLVP